MDRAETRFWCKIREDGNGVTAREQSILDQIRMIKQKLEEQRKTFDRLEVSLFNEMLNKRGKNQYMNFEIQNEKK